MRVLVPRLLAASLLLAFAAQAATTPPPATPKRVVSETLAGQPVNDPYRWLENPEAADVKQWIDAQNAYTEATIGAMPLGKALSARIRELSITSTTRSSPTLAGGTLFYFENTPPQPQPVLVAKAWPDGPTRTLVDLNKGDGNTAVTAYWPSPSGRYLAYGTAEGGSELTTIHILDTTTGKPLGDELPFAGGGTTPQALAWDADEKGVTYARFDAPTQGKPLREFDAYLAHHVIGQPAAKDTVVFGKGYSHVAEYILKESPGGKATALLANEGDGGPAEVYLREGTSAFKRVLGHEADVREASWVGDRLYAVSFAGAPRGKIVALGADGKAVDVLPQGEGAIQHVTALGDGFLVVRSAGPDWWADQYDAKAGFVRRVPLPATGITIGGVAAEKGQGKALISYTGWTQPTRWVEYDGSNGSMKTIFEVKPAADYSKVRVTRVDGTSKDGSKIPVTVISMDGVTPNGKRPTILYSYGGFGIPVTPGFIGANLAWLERGGVLAYANIRGGNEFGEAWHEQGQKTRKQNVFDDFYAASQALIDTHWTDTKHLGILGGSNGGLLMGAALTQHPEQYRAVVGAVGIYDVPRHETAFANGPYNVSEYGSVTDPAVAKAMLAYSPLHNVKKGTKYPAVLLTTGANDPRVAPWQSRKFAAALQDASTSGQPVLLLTRMNAGHGIGAPFSQRVGNAALSMTFFATELGLGE
ncbi:prolyl oligopeptidase family serine peptidase [Luteibacter sp. UNCMF366Tsu5.1]|uniref:prolyl oligopeptidase family serine peptidase n=1 Tax=Luteibacter sp. UNCMF366Tsu5.1 TaxID=1502758 RepID=UPI00090894B4|nr:prolyl oligopeptidase family serine peptidase [Luteibacter sp. UNCMF366Tsu5.1]SFW67873.1 prolyl oligopeptidase [Luteibacter sp. UNCMF366Tsu5.1]